MAIVLLLAFRSRLRLLPLALALASAAILFGLLGVVGGSLTMASVAVAADPDRPRRRLRDPVPGPLGRGGRPAAYQVPRQHASRRLAGGPRSPPPAWRPPPASWRSSSRRPRWSEASASSSSPASRIAFILAMTAGFAALGLRARARGAARSRRGSRARRRREARR